MRWDIITGEYPPQRGGVSDYSRQVAVQFAFHGDEVHVWAPECPDPEEPQGGITVHRLPGCFGLRARREISKALARTTERTRILVQYVPQAFGRRGANLPFCLWLWSMRRHTIWTMFHEVSVPFDGRRGWRRNLLATITWIMAALVARASKRIYISTPAWEGRLHRMSHLKPEWLPAPSNMPLDAPGDFAEAIRAKLAPDSGSTLIGHFSTYSSDISPLLVSWMAALLKKDGRRMGVLIGFRAEVYAADLIRRHPHLADRLKVAGCLPAAAVAAHLAACDLIVQPYPEGVSARRTTVMASLALGRPILTNAGSSTESFWEESGAVVLVRQGESIETAIEAMLRDPQLRASAGKRASEMYREHFCVERLVETLRREAADEK